MITDDMPVMEINDRRVARDQQRRRRLERRADGRVWFVRADADRLPFMAGSVAIVTARAVLHHVARPARTVTELARLLDDGGCLVIRDATAMPTAQAEELRAYLVTRGRPPEPHAGVDPDELAEAAKDAGLLIQQLDRTAGTARLAGPRFSTPAFQLVATRPAMLSRR